MSKIENEIQGVIDGILIDYDKERDIDKLDALCEPDKKMITNTVDQLIRVVYPGYFKDRTNRYYDIKNCMTVVMEDVAFRLNRQINIALRKECDSENAEKCRCGSICARQADLDVMSETITIDFFKRIPEVREYLETDLEAFFDGDPAAESLDEIILAYPGFYAITVYRLAHVLYELKVPVIPRIMTEYAHGQTGIDINPGATIDKYFFIDHGTGIVIGETTNIGKHVKIYQGVTLGALSTRGGRKLQNKKRHPTIEDNVTIYSGASILGGETVIGHDTVIGGNVFITSSIDPETRVSVKNQELRFDSGSVEEIEANFN